MGPPPDRICCKIVLLEYTVDRELNSETFVVNQLTGNFSADENFSFDVRLWFSNVLVIEDVESANDVVQTMPRWYIRTGRPDLLVYKDIIYDKLVLILGEESCHWFFWQSNSPYKQRLGRGLLDIAYCPCCTDLEYLKLINALKVK